MQPSDIVFEKYTPMKLPDGYREVLGRNPVMVDGVVIGIDPGVNFGLTFMVNDIVHVINGKLPTDKRAGWRGIYAFDYMKEFPKLPGKKIAVVEGAAYHSQFGQVALEEVRFGFFLALHQMGYNPVIAAPATIRKLACGSGTVQAGDVFPLLNHNGADSLFCAIAAVNMLLI